jgi:hypothetical protein
MNVITDTIGARVTTTAAATGQQLPGASCTAALGTADFRSGVQEGEERRGQAHPVCRSSSPRPSNGLTFATRRHSKSVDSPYLSRPRMKRRGAISYDKNDAAAEYIRYLGDTLNQHQHVQTRTRLAELPTNKCEHINTVHTTYMYTATLQQMTLCMLGTMQVHIYPTMYIHILVHWTIHIIMYTSIKL